MRFQMPVGRLTLLCDLGQDLSTLPNTTFCDTLLSSHVNINLLNLGVKSRASKYDTI